MTGPEKDIGNWGLGRGRGGEGKGGEEEEGREGEGGGKRGGGRESGLRPYPRGGGARVRSETLSAGRGDGARKLLTTFLLTQTVWRIARAFTHAAL